MLLRSFLLTLLCHLPPIERKWGKWNLSFGINFAFDLSTESFSQTKDRMHLFIGYLVDKGKTAKISFETENNYTILFSMRSPTVCAIVHSVKT